MVCSFVSVICATSLLPASVPIHFPGSLPGSPHLKYLFSLSVSFQTCTDVFVSFEHTFGAVDCLSFFFFLSFPLSLSVCLCHTLSLPRALSFALTPLSTSCCKRANVYFKRCAMHKPPPHRHSTEEKTDTTHACVVQVSTCVSCTGKRTLPHP